MEMAYIQAENLKPVSYTHLDVYKRQPQYYQKVINSPPFIFV